MLKHNLRIFVLACVAAWFASPLTADAKSPSEAKVVIPFDFVSKWDNGRYGQMVGEIDLEEARPAEGLRHPRVGAGHPRPLLDQ